VHVAQAMSNPRRVVFGSLPAGEKWTASKWLREAAEQRPAVGDFDRDIPLICGSQTKQAKSFNRLEHPLPKFAPRCPLDIYPPSATRKRGGHIESASGETT
jgi:hypothetical protein